MILPILLPIYVAADYLINHDRDDNDWDGDGSDSSDGDET